MSNNHTTQSSTASSIHGAASHRKKRKPMEVGRNNEDDDDDDDDDEEEEKQSLEVKGWKLHLQNNTKKRMANNRIHARHSRRRKEIRVQEILKQCRELEKENLKLRTQLQLGKEADDIAEAQRAKSLSNMEAAMTRGASPMELVPILDDFQDRFTDFGIDRPSAFEFRTCTVHRLLKPDLTTSVLSTLLEHVRQKASRPPHNRDEIMANSNNTNTNNINKDEETAIWNSLISHLQLTPGQLAQLQGVENVVAFQQQTLQTLHALHSTYQTYHTELRQVIEKAKEFSNPRMGASYLLWVAKNSACMHLLNELWVELYQRSHENGNVVEEGDEDEEEEEDDEDGDENDVDDNVRTRKEDEGKPSHAEVQDTSPFFS